MKARLETRLEIDLNALKHNFEVIQNQLKPQTKIMGVVKAFAYGSDSVVISKTLQDFGVSYLAVAYIEEGVRLRKANISCPILIFYPQLEEISELIQFNLTPSVYSFHFLKSLHQFLKFKNIKNFPIHLKINTGMNRLGFDKNQFDEVKTCLSDRHTLKLTGIFSHLVASGMPEEKDFTWQQIQDFKTAVKTFETYAHQDLLTHLCNSSGILNYAEAEMDMVRAGIALYGYGNHPKEHKMLQPVSSLKTPIAQLRWIQKGESVGYDRKYIAPEKRHIATLPLGYADGISRLYGNGNAVVKIHEKLAPIVGNVCMDTMMVDVTNMSCREGDEVLIFGKNHSAIDFDFKHLSIPYELITRVSQRVSRVVIPLNK
ncbi:alanine racemase [Flavobacterium sp. CS20]|uniref:alanine racemase n=1 Tax=Flavobacterium sp. CS20 TaxID=2775246 RepID=UPI001B39EC1F|nr:alanine racemase [Flavobacterium sp. CS20]QTY26659.1 alanine racemase [Flavobacterium sp. CS20]